MPGFATFLSRRRASALGRGGRRATRPVLEHLEDRLAPAAPVTGLHYAPNSNFVNGQYAPAQDGFNLADAGSTDDVNALPAGATALVWLGMSGGATSAFQSAVQPFLGNPKVYGFYLDDQPDPSLVPAANLKPRPTGSTPTTRGPRPSSR